MKINPVTGPLFRFVPPILVLALTLSGCKGSDGDEPQGMGGETNNGDGDGDGDGAKPVVSCESDSECDDSLYCNGEEMCENGFCRKGERVRCEDGIECTIDRCDESRDRCESYPPDNDGDGHAAASCLDEDEQPLGDDCDDDDALAFPGNAEVCDKEYRDEDCDPTTIGNKDTDGDGYIDSQCCNEQNDGELECGEDCDDRRANVNPRASEACDFLDNNCDGETDEGVFVDMYPDKDHDGHGDASAKKKRTCPTAVGFAAVKDDCDDSDPEVFKGQFEICDGKDNNCNGEADEVQQQAPWYKDADEDGYGDPESRPVFSCYRVPNRVLSQNDCNDREKTVNPNAPEICDALDNDCNGSADFSVGINDFEDDDRDGSADAACGGDDCDDTDERTSGGADEVCDRIDNDCDGEVDEQTVQNIWYLDEDGDGWGVVVGSALASCDPVSRRAPNFGDCDDENRDVHPGVTEECDGVDQDCDGIIDEGAAVRCSRPNAVTACANSECIIFSCVPGFMDENGDPGDGCEADSPDPVPLGTCETTNDCNNGEFCDGFETCISGECFAGTPINCDASPTVIQGNVSIQSGQDLQALVGIETITGDVTIDGTNLTSLVGLESLEVIGGNLRVQNNPFLKRLSGSALSGLQTVFGTILIENNDSLIDVELPSLLAATSLQILFNPALQSIGTFPNLFKVDQQIYIYSNPALTDIEGFESLARVGGGYMLSGQEQRCSRNWDYGEGVEYGGGIVIVNNLLLEEIDAFHNVEQIDGDLCIIDYSGSELSLPELRGVGMSVDLEYMWALEEVELPELGDVGGDFYLDHTGEVIEGEFPVMRSLSMPQLSSVGGLLEIVADGTTLETLNFPKLKQAGALNWRVTGLTSAFTTMNIDEFAQTQDFSVALEGQTGIADFVAPKLAQVDNQVELNFRLLESQDSVSFPRLEAVGGLLRLYTYNDTPLSLVSFPELVSVAYLDISVDTSDLDIDSLTMIGSDPTNPPAFTLCTASYTDLCADIQPFEDAGHVVNTCAYCP